MRHRRVMIYGSRAMAIMLGAFADMFLASGMLMTGLSVALNAITMVIASQTLSLATTPRATLVMQRYGKRSVVHVSGDREAMDVLDNLYQQRAVVMCMLMKVAECEVALENVETSQRLVNIGPELWSALQVAAAATAATHIEESRN